MANEGYKEYIEKIVKNKIDSFGALAIEKTNSVRGLQVDEGGNVVSLSGSPKAVIKNLLDKFETIAGKVSTITARTVTMGLKRKYPKLDLPKKLTE